METLESLLDFLDSSNTDPDLSDQCPPLTTPHIDSVLSRYRQQPPHPLPSHHHPSHLHPSHPHSIEVAGGHDSRLMQLERQLSDLLETSKARLGKSGHCHDDLSRDGEILSTSSACTSSDRHEVTMATTAHSTSSHRSHDQPLMLATGSGRGQNEAKEAAISSSSDATVRGRHTHNKEEPVVVATRGRRGAGSPAQGRRGASLAGRDSKSRCSAAERRSTRPHTSAAPTPHSHTSPPPPTPTPHPHTAPPPPTPLRSVSSLAEDKQRKKQLLVEGRGSLGGGRGLQEKEESVQGLSRQLDAEREHRWKAEQVVARLVGHVRVLQSSREEARKLHEMAVVRVGEMEREVEGGKREAWRLQEQVKQLQLSLSSAGEEAARTREKEGEMTASLRALEQQARLRETETAEERLKTLAQLHDREQAVAVGRHEVECLRRRLEELDGQVKQLQQLLATREQDHLRQLERCEPLDGCAVRERVEGEVERERGRWEEVVRQHLQRLAEQKQTYRLLEDEFRAALRIEAGRFQELERSYEGVCAEVRVCRETAAAALQRERRATSLMQELTAVAKEQKGRLTELERGREETARREKEKEREVGEEVAARSKLEVKVQTLQEENVNLSAQLSSQQSLVEGLREERRVWGEELARQGASLSQDRGRMEAQIEALSKEVQSLLSQSSLDRDALKIKAKVVEDQSSSLRELRSALAGVEGAGRAREGEWEGQRRALQQRIEEEEAANLELQERASVLTERKAELKRELSSAHRDLEQSQAKYSKLKGQWEDKVRIIEELERSFVKLQESFSEREARLVEEKERAVEQARSAEKRVKMCDDAFREELEAKEKSHDSHVAKLLQLHKLEVHKANERVAGVEVEMRALLGERERERRATEAKLSKLSQAFHELQHDVT